MQFIYPRELEIKETTETAASFSYLDCYIYIDNGKLTTRLYDKRDDFMTNVERCGAVVKHRTRDREVTGSIPTKNKYSFLEQETLSIA